MKGSGGEVSPWMRDGNWWESIFCKNLMITLAPAFGMNPTIFFKELDERPRIHTHIIHIHI